LRTLMDFARSLSQVFTSDMDQRMVWESSDDPCAVAYTALRDLCQKLAIFIDEHNQLQELFC
jgi:hypothetical protein